MSSSSAILTDGAPRPVAAYSQGVRSGPILQASGQLALDPATQQLTHLDDIAGQVTRALSNIEAVLAAGDASLEDLVMVRVYVITDAGFAAFNAAYERFFADRSTSGMLPARTTVIAGLSTPGALVEIDALAIVA